MGREAGDEVLEEVEEVIVSADVAWAVVLCFVAHIGCDGGDAEELLVDAGGGACFLEEGPASSGLEGPGDVVLGVGE